MSLLILNYKSTNIWGYPLVSVSNLLVSPKCQFLSVFKSINILFICRLVTVVGVYKKKAKTGVLGVDRDYPTNITNLLTDALTKARERNYGIA